jgi:hypothetical protein
MAESGKACPTCGKEAGEHGHMCVPQKFDETRCDWCESLIPDARHLCSDKVKVLSYFCNSCGRTAVKDEYLCNPEKIK